MCEWMRCRQVAQFWSDTDLNELLRLGLRSGLRTGNGLQRRARLVRASLKSRVDFRTQRRADRVVLESARCFPPNSLTVSYALGSCSLLYEDRFFLLLTAP